MKINKTKAIIVCGGEATRWKNHLNTPKHLITIENERILDRTTRLLKERGIEDILVVTKEYDERYNTPNSVQCVVDINYEKNADADKFLSSKHLWNTDGRTIVLYGDCYFTDEAIKTIVSFKKKEWTLFCRNTESNITGTPWGECFAISFYNESNEKFEDRLKYIAELHKTNIIKRCGAWEAYGAMVGREGKDVMRSHTKMLGNWVLINDFTEDFDSPEDYEEWLSRRARYNIRNNI